MANEGVYPESRILIIDDNAANVLHLERILEVAGYRNVKSEMDGASAIALIDTFDPDLVIIDLDMTGTDPYAAMRLIRARTQTDLPILVSMAEATPESRLRVQKSGASDFLSKPADPTELSLRVHNFFALRQLNQEVSERTRVLEEKVNERTRALWNSQVEILDRIARLAEFRDDDAPDHNRRVAEISARIARTYGLDKAQVELIRLAAPLHDVGKVAISEQLLNKPGKLSADEHREMARHTIVGADILSGGKTPLLQMAEIIAKHHHERWDGSGYPAGLVGEAIPVPARIVGLADSFDSSMIPRSYRKPLSIEDAMAEVVMSSGTLFEPKSVIAFVDAFKSLADRQALGLVA